MRSLLLLPLLPLLLATTIPTSHASNETSPPSPKPLIVGGWTRIKNVTEPNIQAIGEYAVAEHNKTSPKAGKMFRRVVKGDKQFVAGLNYLLVVEVTSRQGTVLQYLAMVWERPWDGFRALRYFRRITKS
ncbi:cysteine proteinase inhibitor 5-like [Typha latifolia]|uniref:cysteine proteinase inhibitor 5-like n=1 Tax=Typha latifolia TaxID=4733 RepID=UPI003C2FA3C9